MQAFRPIFLNTYHFQSEIDVLRRNLSAHLWTQELRFALCFQIVYVLVIFPYVVLTVLLVRGLTLPNSAAGLIYLLKPQWHRLQFAEVR